MHDDDVDSTIVVVTAAGDREAARAAVERCGFRDAGWAVGELQTTVDGNRKPLTATAMAIPGAIALVTGQAARHARGPGRGLPDDARHVVTAVAYYDLEPPPT